MDFRRPRGRSASENGRYYIFNSSSLNGSSNGSESGVEDEDGPGFCTRPDSRNYLLNVRPENSISSSRFLHYPSGRTTFCAIISQLTEETQPCFDTPLKSRAVSKDCDAKFTCMVSGFPIPDVTWYKDDEEMDRYCGLPKYQILRNGKRHTLQLYKCSEEDAAIYQASARNNKGIVSCSGVLEVGAMTEYKIHQRWFAKLKRKAEAKMREIEQSRKRGKENVEDGDKLRTLSPERFQRKRRFSVEGIIGSPTPLMKNEDVVKVHIPDPNLRLHDDNSDSMEQQLNADNILVRSNREEITTNGYTSQDNLEENGQDFLAYVYETVEKITKRPTAKESLAKKKKKEEEHIAVTEVKLDDTARGDGVKKSNSPAANRPRFSPRPVKVHVQEAMEVEESPTIEANRKNVASTMPPKSPRLISSKQLPMGDGRKLREGETSKEKKTKDSKQSTCSEPSQEIVHFSLKDMYLENTLSPREVNMPPVPDEADVKNKCEPKRWDITQQENPPETIKALLPNVVRDPPKPIPRRSKIQRGMKPELKELKSAVIMTMDATSSPLDLKNNKLERQNQKTKLNAELLSSLPAEIAQVPEIPSPRVSSLHIMELAHSPPAETVPAPEVSSSSRLSSLPSTEIPLFPPTEVAPDPEEIPLSVSNSMEVFDRTVKETDLLDSVPSSDESVLETGMPSMNPVVILKDSLPPLQDEIRNPQPSLSKEQMVCQILSESTSREETLIKFHELEIEYRALQRAYALLQEQLGANQPTKQDTQVSDEDNGLTSDEARAPAVPEPMEERSKSLQDFSDESAPVYMETELSQMGESSLLPESVSQNLLQEEHIEYIVEKSKTPSTELFGTPLADEVHSSKEGARFDKDDTMGMEVRDKDALPLFAVQADHQRDYSSQQPETTISTFTETIPKPESKILSEVIILHSEAEMMVATKQVEQVVIGTGKPESLSAESLLSTAIRGSVGEEKCRDASHSISSWASGVGEDINKTQSGIVLSLSGEIVPPASSLSNIQELPAHKVDVSGTASQENGGPADSRNQSVATLLRNVKKELDIQKPYESVAPKEERLGIALREPVRMSPMEDSEVELMLQMSEEEVKGDREDLPQSDGLKLKDETLESKKKFIRVYETKDPMSRAATVPLVSRAQHEEELGQDDIISMDQGKQDSGLMASLKNSLLMLLNLAPMVTDKGKDVVKEENKLDTENNQDDQLPPDKTDHAFPDMGIGGLLPVMSNKIVETPKNDDSFQSAESMPSSSTSGLMTPSSEEDMVPNVETLQSSTTTSGKNAEIQSNDLTAQVGPREARKAAGLNNEELQLSLDASRKLTTKGDSETEGSAVLTVPAIVVGNIAVEGSVKLSDLQPDGSLKEKSGENTALIPSATPEELASGARRKIYLPKPKQLNDVEPEALDSPIAQTHTKRESPNVSPGMSRRYTTLLQCPVTPQSPPTEKRSPNLARKMATLEVPNMYEEPVDKGKTTEDITLETKDSYADAKDEGEGVEPKKINDPYKAPQVIRKIRAEQFSDVSAGNLKLWCQFFNVLSDSVITWYKDDYRVAEVKKCSGDEGQVALAIVQASRKDCGVYQCAIQNVYGTDSTDFLLSAEVLSGIISREEAEVGEEIEMTPMVFAKGLADSGYWGDKYFGRIVTEDGNVGEGYLRKVCRAKVIYGLEPMFESGKTCLLKIRNFITFGTKNENTLIEKNYDITIQECKIQNTTREYCKIFAAEARAIPDFGQVPEIIPLNLIYRPANNVPYATIEEDLVGHFEKHCTKDRGGALHMQSSSEIDQKCCTFQHWVYQWTNGNFLVTVLEGVGWRITNIGIATKSKGYQGLKESCFPALMDQFTSVHQCNRYCEMLGLKSLKNTDAMQQSTKPKGSKSPSTGRKAGSAQSSPQMPKKGLASPQGTRKCGSSPKTARKTSDPAEAQPASKHRTVEIPRSVRMR